MATAYDLVYRKIVRAWTKVSDIEAAIAEYAGSEPYEVILQPSGKQHVTILRQPPQDIAIHVGELLYQCKSTLDHLFFHLVELKRGPVTTYPDRWMKECQFPLNTEAPTGIAAPVPRSKFQSGARDWISDDAFAFIEGLQPYYRWKSPNDLLFVLTKLSNIDKHRRLNTTVVRFDFKHIVTTAEGFQSTFMTGNFDDGAELPTAYHETDMLNRAVSVKPEIIPRIAFDEPELVGFGLEKPQPYLFEALVHKLPTLIFNFILPHFEHFYRQANRQDASPHTSSSPW